jgi:general secretion pathway protein L
MREIASLVPAGPRAAVQRRRTRPVIAFDGDVATFWQPAIDNGRLSMVETATVALGGEPATTVAEGRAAVARQAAAAGGVLPKVVISLDGRAVLRKTLVLPAAVEEDLRQALTYDLDRHTPFKSEELYFDAAILERDQTRGQIRVDMAAARRAQVDAAVKHAQAWGATVAAVVPEPPANAAASRLNLLPPEMRQSAQWWRQFWLPIALLAAVALIAVVLPVWQKREYAIAQNEIAAQAFQKAAAADALRSQLERQVGDYNFALERKYAYPSTVQILEDVTRLLPDDTWLTQLEIKTAGRGKEAQRELLVRGESVNAGRLVTLLEDSRLFTQAAPRSPTTKIQPGPGEIFDLGAQMKPLPAPVSVALASLERPPSPAAPAPPPKAVAPPSPTAAAPAAPAPLPKTVAPPPPTAAAPAPGSPANPRAGTPPAPPGEDAAVPAGPPPAIGPPPATAPPPAVSGALSPPSNRAQA